MVSTHDMVVPNDTELASLGDALGQDAAGLERRRGALAALLEAPAPDRVTHLWRFTDPHRFAPAASVAAVGFVEKGDAAGTAAAVDLVPGLQPLVTLSDAARAAGLDVLPFGDPSVAAHLGAALGAPESHWYALLNDAAWNTGVALRLPRGRTLTDPVRVSVHAEAAAVLPRSLLIAEENSELTLVEEHTGGVDEARVAGVTEILAGPAARVRHVLVQAWRPGVDGYVSVRARADRDADLQTVFCALGGDRAKLEFVSTLDGAGAASRMVGVILGEERQHLDVHTRHIHAVGETRSDIDVKAVVADRARSTYTGLIRIEERARGVEAFQENRNLLLSDGARADTIPELEILNQEVACSHGATVAPLDEGQVFYLRSRGLDAAQARRMIVRGFLENTLARLPEGLRARVEAVVERRLDSVGDGA
ncbi:Fe-S cluster assembly protein SufD [bacterium]|nr:Fe-S cluster assembly protein SufD [bacterium]